MAASAANSEKALAQWKGYLYQYCGCISTLTDVSFDIDLLDSIEKISTLDVWHILYHLNIRMNEIIKKESKLSHLMDSMEVDKSNANSNLTPSEIFHLLAVDFNKIFQEKLKEVEKMVRNTAKANRSSDKSFSW